jgi:hypothetical protein
MSTTYALLPSLGAVFARVVGAFSTHPNFGQERSMKNVRVVLAVVALLALPFGSVAAQGRPKPRVRPANEVAGECKDQQAATLARAVESGQNAPYGLDKKCDDPVPPPSTPPSGPHHVDGLVYEELDGNAGYDPFAGDLGIADVPVQLSWNGQVIASAVSAADGSFSFTGLGGTFLQPAAFTVCVSGPIGFVQVWPDPSAAGAPCGGAGYPVSFNSDIETGFRARFGYLLQ